MKISRKFTSEETGAYGAMEFRKTSSEIRNPDGSIVFSLKDLEVPASWSQVASDVLAQKYFRKAGVPAATKRVKEKGVPAFLQRSVPDEKALAKLPEDERYGGETSSQQVFDRLAGAWAYWGWKGGYFSVGKRCSALILTRCAIMLANSDGRAEQHHSGSIPVCIGPTALMGQVRAISTSIIKTGKLVKSKTAYEHPQPHACFIQSVSDDLVNEGGIMDLCGPVKRVCSSMARGRAPTFRRCVLPR